MRVSAATGVVDFEVLNEFLNRVIDRASSGRSPVRRWQPPARADDASSGGEGSSAIGFIGAVVAGMTGASADAV